MLDFFQVKCLCINFHVAVYALSSDDAVYKYLHAITKHEAEKERCSWNGYNVNSAIFARESTLAIYLITMSKRVDRYECCASYRAHSHTINVQIRAHSSSSSSLWWHAWGSDQVYNHGVDILTKLDAWSWHGPVIILWMKTKTSYD